MDFLNYEAPIKAPEWTRDLVIYEINPYAFSSPDGPGSGTFTSLCDKMDYIQALGVTGIWLAGFSEATTHFYNIKSVYACVRPDRLDPFLGTPDEFKVMIAEAHKRGIRIFLDVITHGVIKESSLRLEHPSWFKGGTWRMADYDYDNPDFQEWWVRLWTGYVTDYGVDGFRLDVPRHHQMFLWYQIAARCQETGHPIVIFPERVTIFHFGQRDYVGFCTDMAGEFCPTPRYAGVQISSHDEGWECGPGNYYRLRGNRAKLAYTLCGYNIPIFMSGEEFDAHQVSLPSLERNLYGGGGAGGWLYGSWLKWEQLERSKHRDMLADFKRWLSIRRQNRDILHADRTRTHILRVNHTPPSRPIPYVRFIPSKKAIVVVANNEKVAETFRLRIPLEQMELGGYKTYRVTDLWEDSVHVVPESALRCYEIAVPGAYSPGGGARAIKIEPSGNHDGMARRL